MILSTLVMALAVACAHGGSYQKPNPDPPRENSYDSKVRIPQDPPKSSYGSKIPVPVPDAPQNNYGGDRAPKPMPLPIPHDTPSGSYGSGGPMPLPVPHDTPSGSYGSGGSKKNLDTPKNSYGAGGWVEKPMDPTDDGYGDDLPIGSDVEPIASGGTCQTSDRWMGVVGCYDCELNACAKECLSELPKNFEMCYNKTALFNLKSLFLDCLGNDFSKCHRLTEDMSLAFLLAHFDQRILDVNRRDECIFRCGRPRVMNCMNMCDPLNGNIDIQKEPIVACYKSLESKIHEMLIEFATCLNQYGNLTKK